MDAHVHVIRIDNVFALIGGKNSIFTNIHSCVLITHSSNTYVVGKPRRGGGGGGGERGGEGGREGGGGGGERVLVNFKTGAWIIHRTRTNRHTLSLLSPKRPHPFIEINCTAKTV